MSARGAVVDVSVVVVVVVVAVVVPLPAAIDATSSSIDALVVVVVVALLVATALVVTFDAALPPTKPTPGEIVACFDGAARKIFCRNGILCVREMKKANKHLTIIYIIF